MHPEHEQARARVEQRCDRVPPRSIRAGHVGQLAAQHDHRDHGERPRDEHRRRRVVDELLEALQDYHHLHLALLTGNYREAAEIKLQHFEIWDFFEWGAFSDDHHDRNELVPIARTRAYTYDIPPEAIDRIIVIGDTPHDIECARVAGAQCIAVATGGYSMAQLKEAGANEVLPNLSDTEKVISLLIE